VTVPAGQLIHKPANLGWEIAGSLYVAGCTAFAAVRAVEAKVGETVAVAGASGGVGSIVVQLLKAKGVNVLGISSARNADWLATHGVIPVAYGPGLDERLRAAAPPGIDAFIDLFGPEYVQLAADLGVPRQRIETTISFQKAHELGAKQDGSVTASTPDVLREMATLVADGTIEFTIAATYPLERVTDAFAELEKRHTRGKIVLLP
jgi:NADPH:quinone reductase-like Zn-dependent oxidoreductase